MSALKNNNIKQYVQNNDDDNNDKKNIIAIEQQQQQHILIEEEKIKDDNQWPCQYCTFLNINNNTKLCQVCGGHKEQFIYAVQLQQLKDMGFNNEDAVKAQLMAQAGNIDRAAHNLLLNVN
eukprot:36565_1